jgi:hypothetical protein
MNYIQQEAIFHSQLLDHYHKKGKVIPVTGHGGPWGCETLRPPHILESLLTDGGEVVSLTHPLPPGRLVSVRG